MSEHSQTEHVGPTAFGLSLTSNIDPNWTPLECVAVVVCLDQEGVRRLTIASTEGITDWDLVGMLISASDAYREDLKKTLLDEDEEDLS